MVDNVRIPLGTEDGATIALDDIGGVHYPRSKISLGADGTAVDAVAGAGVVGTGVQRVTLGSDDPAVTALELLDNAVSGDGFNVTQFAGVGISMGTGGRDAGTQRVTIATDDAVPVNPSPVMAGNGFWLHLDGASELGTERYIGFGFRNGSGNFTQVAAATPLPVDLGTNALPAGANLIGDVSLQPRTTGGLTMHKTTSAASTNATSVKASAGQVYSIQCSNVNAAARYLKLYNKASAPTVGTDTPVKTLLVPGNTAGAGFVIPWPQGLAFATGIAFALTTEATDAGTTGVAANELTVNIDYK